MFPCWNPVLQILFKTVLNLLCHQYSLMASLNMKYWRFLSLNWITDTVSVNSFIWPGGSDTKVPMKKPLGYPPTNLLMLPTLFLISIPHILPNPVPFQFNKICQSIFIPFRYSSVIPHHFTPSIIFPFCFHFVIFLSAVLFSSLLFTPNQSQEKTVQFQKKQIYQVHFMIHYIFLGGRSGGCTICVISSLLRIPFSVSFPFSFYFSI